MRVPSFADHLAASFPPDIAMPAELRLALDWLEAESAVIDTPSGPCATLYPADSDAPEARQSYAAFLVPEPGASAQMLGPHPPRDAGARLSLFLCTGGDGSYAGLWCDDAGRQVWVHHGSGSGSVWFDVITDNTLDLLRFLAIGYAEPAFDECHDLTPEAAFLHSEGLTAAEADALDPAALPPRPIPPLAFQAFLIRQFNTTIPACATEIITSPLGRGDQPGTPGHVTPDNPFFRWLMSR